ncbi:MAG TPA: glycosyltransferase family 4 protein [Candidatus Sulfotelmatobacter sp.]|nr:glycosyltransferase family 4 protein [Candidatus Sulfotelmatobacter sp.]
MSLVLAESGRAVGGTERVVWELATRLPRNRFEVRVWLSDDPGVDEFAAALEAQEIPVDRVGEVDSRWDWKGMLQTWRKLRGSRASLLHVHHVWPAADRYLASLAGLAGIPHFIVTEHIVGQPNSAAQKSLKRRELMRADAVTAVCSAVADSLARDYGVPRQRLRVVPNGADPPDENAEWEEARTWREKLGAGQLRPLWVSAARLEEQKGHDVFLAALAELNRRGVEFTAAIAGEGSKRLELERQIAERGLGSRVRLLGQLENLGPLLLAADAVVLASRWEGLPLTLLEALARGRPVVATSVGGIPDVIEDNVTGRLIASGQSTPLADALADFARRSDAALKLGRNGQRRVRESYGWERVVEQFEAVYDEVLGLATFVPGPAEQEAE